MSTQNRGCVICQTPLLSSQTCRPVGQRLVQTASAPPYDDSSLVWRDATDGARPFTQLPCADGCDRVCVCVVFFFPSLLARSGPHLPRASAYFPNLRLFVTYFGGFINQSVKPLAKASGQVTNPFSSVLKKLVGTSVKEFPLCSFGTWQVTMRMSRRPSQAGQCFFFY